MICDCPTEAMEDGCASTLGRDRLLTVVNWTSPHLFKPCDNPLVLLSLVEWTTQFPWLSCAFSGGSVMASVLGFRDGVHVEKRKNRATLSMRLNKGFVSAVSFV